MTINVITTSIRKPPKLVIYGKPGIGKSRFARSLPNPFFIRTEDRHDHLSVQADDHVILNYMDLISGQLDELIKDPRGFKSVVLDTADSAEKIVHAYVAHRAGTDNILDPKALPFYQGMRQSAMIWENEILPRLTRLNEEKRMLPCIISHISTAHIMHPVYGDYPQFTLGVDSSRNGCASKIFKWADIVAFMDWQTTTVGKEETGNLRLRSTDQRVLRIKPKAGWETKESYNLPESIDIPADKPGEFKGWSVLAQAIKEGIAQNNVGGLAEVTTAHEAKRLTEPKASGAVNS